MVRGPCPDCHPYWGVCLVLQDLLGVSWNPSGHMSCAVLLRDALFILASARLGTLGDSMLCLFLERGCGVLCFRHGFCGENSGPSLAPRFAGITVPAQPTRDNRNGRHLYPVQAVKGYLVRFGYASSAMRAVTFCHKV